MARLCALADMPHVETAAGVCSADTVPTRRIEALESDAELEVEEAVS